MAMECGSLAGNIRYVPASDVDMLCVFERLIDEASVLYKIIHEFL
jgi:hypothetical protein